MSDSAGSSIVGVIRRPLITHTDDRGSFAEIFRTEWLNSFAPLQWNVLRSEANVIRGLHCHILHTDYVSVIDGSMLLYLHDLRSASASVEVNEVLVLERGLEMVVIPPGVAHAFLHNEAATLVQAVSHTWVKSDELGCRWDDSELNIVWHGAAPTLSPRDAGAGSLQELRDQVCDVPMVSHELLR